MPNTESVLQTQITISQFITIDGTEISVCLSGEKSSLATLIGMIEIAKLRLITQYAEEDDD